MHEWVWSTVNCYAFMRSHLLSYPLASVPTEPRSTEPITPAQTATERTPAEQHEFSGNVRHLRDIICVMKEYDS